MDKEIKCIEKDCGQTFTMSEGEEQFFVDKGMYLPKRCPDCRSRRKREREDSEGQQLY